MKRTFPAPRPIHELEDLLNYTFHDESILRRALTHPTYTNERNDPSLPNYEQLEFLGDAVLSFLVRDFLFAHYPQISEGILSSAHSNVVSKDALPAYAKKLSLGDFLYLGRGAQAQNLRNNQSILENAFEALVAALYLDGGIEVAKDFVLPFVEEDLHRLVSNMKRTGSATDCKTRLQHFIQEDYTSHTYRYEELGKTGPDHDPQFCMGVLLDEELIAKGYGSSKKKAEEEAARKALQYFKLEPQD